MRRLSTSLLNKIENDVSQSHNLSADGGCFREFGSRISVLMCHASHPNLRIRLCPNLHLLMTFCRQLPSSGHTGMRFQWSMSLS
jgi:hypothetical protein